METPIERLQEELRNEKAELKVNAVLTAVSLLGLLAGVYFQLTGAGVWYTGISFFLSYLAGGAPATRESLAQLRKGQLEIDLLMVLAALAAAAVGEVRDGAILLFLFSISSTLEGYAMGNTKRAVVALMKLRPEEATVQKEGGVLEKVAVDSLEVGQVVLVKPGERIPVDGVVLQGQSAIDQSSVTGESVPIDKAKGDQVFAGSLNGYGSLSITVTKKASHSTIAQMIQLVTEAQAKRSPSEQFSDWFGHRYTIFVLVGSAASLCIFILFGLPYSEAFYKAATLLVVASPCAIVISVPAAILSALASSAKKGILFKGGGALETFGKATIVAFDKTGTLTTGLMKVTDAVVVTGTQSDFLNIATALESHSEHPLAKSILEYTALQPTTTLEVETPNALPGKGMVGMIDGKRFWAGNTKMFDALQVTAPPSVLAELKKFEEAGKTTIMVGQDETVLGIFAIADTVRESAASAVAAMRTGGIKRVVMLTGDNESVAHQVAKQIGIAQGDVYASLLPADKVACIETLHKEGVVAFVGDGVNDAAALATAHVGIAMGSAGSDVALEAADVALLANDLHVLIKARALSSRTNTIIKQNLYFAVGILVLMVFSTFIFHFPLPLGVIGHEGGTLLVVLNGLRLLF